jgi:hypothetical protein
MALIKLSGVAVGTISGKLSGSVFSRNGGGAYVRVKTKPFNEQSSSQTTVRANLTSLAQAWQLLTAAQILAWNSFGANQIKTNRIGDKSQQSGFNAFIEFNQSHPKCSWYGYRCSSWFSVCSSPYYHFSYRCACRCYYA